MHKRYSNKHTNKEMKIEKYALYLSGCL